MIRDAVRRKIDIVVFKTVDRLATGETDRLGQHIRRLRFSEDFHINLNKLVRGRQEAKVGLLRDQIIEIRVGRQCEVMSKVGA